MIYIATIIWAGLIFYGSSVPGSTLPQAPDATSFLVHFFEYSILGLLLAKANLEFKIQNLNFKNKVYIVLIVGFLYAVSDEVHQLFVVGRHFELIDLVVDGIGLVTGMFVVALKYHDRHVKKYKK